MISFSGQGPQGRGIDTELRGALQYLCPETKTSPEILSPKAKFLNTHTQGTHTPIAGAPGDLRVLCFAGTAPTRAYVWGC